MPKIRDIQQAIDKTLTHLALEEYDEPDEIVTISRKLIAQVHILELYRMGCTRLDIARKLEVNEKTIRMWLNADHVPSLEHAIALERLYKKTRKAHDKKSTR